MNFRTSTVKRTLLSALTNALPTLACNGDKSVPATVFAFR